ELQRSLHLEAGPLLAAGYFHVPDTDQGRLLLAIHHLAVDGVSWRILLDELEDAYRAYARGAVPGLPSGVLPWSAWVGALSEYARSASVQAERAVWTQLLAAGAADPFGLGTSLARAADGVDLSHRFDAEWTARLIEQAPRAYRLQLDEVLLAALV